MRRKQLELRDLRNFLAIANTMNFGRAAAQLHIAQPVLSKQIKQMEGMLGCALFERHGRGISLTYAGEFLLLRAEALQASLRDAIERTQQIGKGQVGSITAVVCDSVMYTKFSKVVERFQKEHPKVALQIREMSARQQLAQLRDGTVDVGFIREGEPTEGLVVRRLLSEPLIAVLPLGHALEKEAKIKPSDFAGQKLVLFSHAKSRLLRVFRDDDVHPNVVQRVRQWSTLLSLVRSDAGIAIAPASVSILAMEGVVFRPLDSKRRSTVDVVTCPDTRNSATALLLRTVEKVFRMQL